MNRILFSMAVLSQLGFAADFSTRLKWLLEGTLLGIPKFETTRPPTSDSVALGRLLFYDKRLSVDGTVSCASCHNVENGFSNQLAGSVGIQGQVGKRKAQPILNKAFAETFFWDGRAGTLEKQAAGPLFNSIEMGNNEENLLATLRAISGYQLFFDRAFGDKEITLARITSAISDFERTLLSGNSRYDRFVKDSAVYTVEEKRGLELFNERECALCHKPPFFTDDNFHNTGVGFANGKFADEGRVAISKDTQNTGAFKTPTLRNLGSHAPYMHDGSQKTLEEVIDFYNNGGKKNPYLSEKIIRLGLQPEDKKALLAFLRTLEGEGFEETEPEMPQ